MTTLSTEEFKAFQGLVTTDDGFKEKECTQYLHAATDFLLGKTPVSLIELGLEQRSPYGRSDYIIVADLKSNVGAVERHLIFFELKAPQCFLMQHDDSTRYRPSNDLVKAETQLIHYVQQAMGDQVLKERHGVVTSENVSAGGIIIGRDDHMANVNTDEKRRDAHLSFKLRQRALYREWNILTWNRILILSNPKFILGLTIGRLLSIQFQRVVIWLFVHVTRTGRDRHP
ncbi:Shedu anti-phage system protein SduA domain-containing protein [Mesorhizobium sp. M0676]|uniref:Shedu anti-phage system protein SduA domain-containing protein n=1 Tax=Mesorhizobium sp. M0676 TaxID=2956984 RepID=UPI0033389FFB